MHLAAGLENIHVVGFLQRKAFVLRHEVAVHAFAHIIVTPIYAVQIHHHGSPSLVNNICGVFTNLVKPIDQHALESVVHTRPYAVVTAVSQHKAPVLDKVQIVKQLCVKVLCAILGLGAHLEGFLGHVQAVLTLEAKLHALAKHLITFLVVQLHITRPRDFAKLTVYRIFKGDSRRLINVGADGEHAVFSVPQLIGVGDEADDGKRMIKVKQIGLRDNLARLKHAALIKRPCAKHVTREISNTSPAL